ncbi:flagellar hook-basal body complex protein FliE, partial [Enterobacter hormaechei subsp. steigerwaltii]|nr:flagellar hook-basal body complex protein FliE [Enterobacter hormaechei subsp. steigerwaltii]
FKNSAPVILYTPYQWPLPVAFLSVFPGWTQDDSYRIRRSSRTERGVRAQKASVSLQMGLQVRNKLVSAYQEVMGMQV